ncbi:MAG TPA: DUF6526 family protein [Luteitalea sp.]|nr:DUF6526 family protein [Luteitalea sp.]
MSGQSYATHVHRPVLTVVAAVGWVVSLSGAVATLRGNANGPALFMFGLLVAVFTLISISRVYTTKLQDRIIELEERLRAERLLAPAQMAEWRTLTPKQIAALRFASDSEFTHLAARAAGEDLKPDAIKRAVTEWRADHRRT